MQAYVAVVLTRAPTATNKEQMDDDFVGYSQQNLQRHLPRLLVIQLLK